MGRKRQPEDTWGSEQPLPAVTRDRQSVQLSPAVLWPALQSVWCSILLLGSHRKQSRKGCHPLLPCHPFLLCYPSIPPSLSPLSPLPALPPSLAVSLFLTTSPPLGCLLQAASTSQFLGTSAQVGVCCVPLLLSLELAFPAKPILRTVGELLNSDLHLQQASRSC